MNVKHQSAAGVGGVGCVYLATSQFPDQETVNGAEQQIPVIRLGPGAGYILQDPAQFGPGKVGVKEQAGLLVYRGFMPRLF